MFKNEFGQEIDAGDEIAVITVRHKTVKMSTGTYLGQTSTGRCRVELDDEKYELRYKDNGELVDWKSHSQIRPYDAIKVAYKRRTTLVLNRIYKLNLKLAK